MDKELVVRQMQLGPLMNFIYLVGSHSTGEAAVVDPGWEPDEIVAVAQAEGLTIGKILLTHTHRDHVMTLERLLERIAVPVYVNKHEAGSLRGSASETIVMEGDEEVELGTLTVRSIHTPGHSPGSQCFLVDDHLFSGDTLFVGSCGRCDLPDSDPAELYHSLQRLAQLDGDTIVLPGHNYGYHPTSTIEDERQRNPYLRVPSLEMWLSLMGYQ